MHYIGALMFGLYAPVRGEVTVYSLAQFLLITFYLFLRHATFYYFTNIFLAESFNEHPSRRSEENC